MTQMDKTGLKPYKQGSQEWHAARSKGLGGSDMAAIMGLNPWKTPYQVWLEKTGRVKSTEETEKMTIGKEIEDFVASQYTRITGRKTRRVNKFKTSDLYPFIGGSVDRIFQDEEHGLGILEMKNVSSESFRNTFAGGVPDYYFIQVQTYMLVFKAQIAELFVFVGGERFEVFRIARNEQVIDAIVKSAKNFWEFHIKEDIAPPAQNKEDMKIMFPAGKTDPNAKPANEDVFDWVQELAQIKREIKEREELKEKLELQIMQDMGEYETLVDGNDKPLVTWKSQLRTDLDKKALKEADPDTYKAYEKTTEHRVFLLKVK